MQSRVLFNPIPCYHIICLALCIHRRRTFSPSWLGLARFGISWLCGAENVERIFTMIYGSSSWLEFIAQLPVMISLRNLAAWNHTHIFHFYRKWRNNTITLTHSAHSFSWKFYGQTWSSLTHTHTRSWNVTWILIIAQNCNDKTHTPCDSKMSSENQELSYDFIN